MLTIRQIFLYLDRTHVLANTMARSLFDMGLQLLGRHLAERPEVGIVAIPPSAGTNLPRDNSRRWHTHKRTSYGSDSPQVERHAVKGLMTLVERERRGEGVDRPLLQSLLRMMHSLGTYAESFQRPFLEESGRFYRVEGAAQMMEMAIPEYLKHCEVGPIRPGSL